MSRSEPKTSDYSSKGRLVVTRMEPRGGQEYEAQFVDDQQVEAG